MELWLRHLGAVVPGTCSNRDVRYHLSAYLQHSTAMQRSDPLLDVTGLLNFVSTVFRGPFVERSSDRVCADGEVCSTSSADAYISSVGSGILVMCSIMNCKRPA